MVNPGTDIIQFLERRKQELEVELAKVNAAIEAYQSAVPQIYSAPSTGVRHIKLKPRTKRIPWTRLVAEIFEEHDYLTTGQLIEILKMEKGVQALDNESGRNSLGTTVLRMREKGILAKSKDGKIYKIQENGKEGLDEKRAKVGNQATLDP